MSGSPPTPVTWNVVPNQRDAITNTDIDPSRSVFPTVVYRRYTRGWRKPLANSPSGNQNLIPGPLIRARVGDRLRIHFKNLDHTFRRPHSMHFHGVTYKPDSDGSYVPGFSGRDANVPPGGTLDLPADGRSRFRGCLALPRPLAVDARVHRRWPLRDALDRGAR